MKIKIILSNSGEFRDIEFQDVPKNLNLEVQTIEEEL